MSESKAHKQLGCFTVFLISLYDLQVLFLIQRKTADASFHHSLSALPHFSLGTSQWYLCWSPLSWSCTASCWRSGVQFQQLASAQLRLMGSCRPFLEHTTWKSCVLLTQVTSAPFQFTKSNCWSPSSSRMLQHRIASLCVLILCSSCWQHRVLPLAKHICCSSRAVCHPALLHQYKSCHNRDFQVGWKRKLSDLGGASFQPTCPLLFTSFSFPQEK